MYFGIVIKCTGKRFTIFQKIIGKTFVLSPVVYLLNCTADLCLDCDKESLLNFCIYLAKKMYTIIMVNCSDTFNQYVDESGDN